MGNTALCITANFATQCLSWVISVDIAVSALSSAIHNTGHTTTSDRDPSACCLPAPFLQTTGTAAAAPASWLRTATNLRAICGRGVGLVFLFDRSLAKDFAGKIMDFSHLAC